MNYSELELRETFSSVGEDVTVHKSIVVVNGKNIRIGSHVRIDCFCLLSAGEQGIVIGNHVHIAVGCYLFGSGGLIEMEDFSGLSARVSLFTATDDYLFGFMTNPTVPHKYKKVRKGNVVLKRHALVGSGSVVMPCTLGLATSVAALSLVGKDVPDFEVVKGNPALRVTSRHRRILDLERMFRQESQS